MRIAEIARRKTDSQSHVAIVGLQFEVGDRLPSFDDRARGPLRAVESALPHCGECLGQHLGGGGLQAVGAQQQGWLVVQDFGAQTSSVGGGVTRQDDATIEERRGLRGCVRRA